MKATNGGYTEAEIYRVLDRRALVKPPIFIEDAMQTVFNIMAAAAFTGVCIMTWGPSLADAVGRWWRKNHVV